MVLPLSSPVKQISSYKSKALLLLESDEILLVDISSDGIPYIVLRQNLRSSQKLSFDKNYSVISEGLLDENSQNLQSNLIQKLITSKSVAETE